jgi:hypothetical protein
VVILIHVIVVTGWIFLACYGCGRAVRVGQAGSIQLAIALGLSSLSLLIFSGFALFTILTNPSAAAAVM